MVKRIGGISLAESLQNQQRGASQATLSEIGLLGAGGQVVDQLSSGAADVSLSGRITGEVFGRPQMTVTELRELQQGSKGPVPYFRVGATQTADIPELDDAGYVELDTVDIERVYSDVPDTFSYDIALTRAGTRGDSFRSVAVSPSTVTHPFGSGTDAYIGIPETASTVLWMDGNTRETTVASHDGTTASSRGTVERYLLSDAPSAYDPLQLVYDISYGEDVRGVRLFDTRGNSDKYDGDGRRQWQSINYTRHDINNAVVISNGQTRLRIRERDDGTPAVETADWGAGSWGAWTDITPSGHDPLDLDLIDIDQQRVEAQLLFVSDTGSSTYAVNLSLTPGYADPLVYPAPSESTGIPSDIDSAFSGTARTSEKRTQATRTLVSREAVRR